MMIKKKDRLLQLVSKDIVQLSLASKKYYIQLMPYLQLKQLDLQKTPIKSEIIKPVGSGSKCKKKKGHKKNISSESQELEQVQVQVQKVSLSKWAAKNDISNISETWTRIEKLPFLNSYLNKKIQTRSSIFFQNKQTKDILYVNRSMVDPNLDFEKGSFDDQLENDIYESMYESEVGEVDFSSQETLLKRQKQLLSKINTRKAQHEQADTVSFQKQLAKAAGMKRIAIVLCFGGSFSVGVYEGEKCTLHKSDKKYVCRKKAGERQFNKDKQSGSSIKSMGSQIRRDQEKKHVINVNQILNENRDALFGCDLIFLQAPGMNRLYIINENQTMAKLQAKLRSVCLTAKKANFTEIQSIFDNISKVNLVKIKE